MTGASGSLSGLGGAVLASCALASGNRVQVRSTVSLPLGGVMAARCESASFLGAQGGKVGRGTAGVGAEAGSVPAVEILDDVGAAMLAGGHAGDALDLGRRHQPRTPHLFEALALRGHGLRVFDVESVERFAAGR
jgi:hypothetical protein